MECANAGVFFFILCSMVFSFFVGGVFRDSFGTETTRTLKDHQMDEKERQRRFTAAYDITRHGTGKLNLERAMKDETFRAEAKRQVDLLARYASKRK